jgi:hypothetical protein
MLALPYKNRLHESGYVRFLIDMTVTNWYDKLAAELNKEGVVCSIEKNGGKATLTAPYGTNVISRLRQIIMGTISEDLNPKDKDHQENKESLLRPVLERSVFYKRTY